MAAEGAADRVALGPVGQGLSYRELLTRSRGLAGWIAQTQAERVAILDRNTPAVPLLLFASAIAGRPFVPLSYRLAPEQLARQLDALSPAVLVAAPEFVTVEVPPGVTVVTREELPTSTGSAAAGDASLADNDDVAMWLFTSGTTGTPKVAVLRHRHMLSYVISTVEFLGASEDEATLVSVPPYHIAGISALLSSAYAGRRVVQLEAFDPAEWVSLARRELVTHAMVVPTMLGRILDQIEADGHGLPHLRHLSYGGGRMPAAVIERALNLLPDVDFVNAYGLTETSSTISVLGPEDHRAACASTDPAVRARLRSVGRPVPGIEMEIRDPDGRTLASGQTGEIYVRGEQVAGEYLGARDGLTAGGAGSAGWFATRDMGRIDADGYLYLDGRLDDVIVRGGENIAPAEIEEVLLAHPAVAEAGVVGVPDDEWGEQVVAAVVTAEGEHVSETELRDWVRGHLRSARTPTRVAFVPALPYTDTGKLLRHVVRAALLDPDRARPEPADD